MFISFNTLTNFKQRENVAEAGRVERLAGLVLGAHGDLVQQRDGADCRLVQVLFLPGRVQVALGLVQPANDMNDQY